MANKTTNRGRGFPARRLVINQQDGTAFYDLMQERHNYSHGEAITAILSGELATVLLPNEQRAAFLNNAEKLAAMIEPEDWIAAEAIKSIAEQLWEARQRETDD